MSLEVDSETGRRGEIILSDTVGFIRDLPDELVNAFKATLEELSNASLLLHVLDASDPLVMDRQKAVYTILEEMDLRGIPEILVFNKIDAVTEDRMEELRHHFGGVFVSALARTGIPELCQEISTRIFPPEGSCVTNNAATPA